MSPTKQALLAPLPHALRTHLLTLAMRAGCTLDLVVQGLLGRFDAPPAIAADVAAILEQLGEKGLAALATWPWTCAACGQDADLKAIATCATHTASTCSECSPDGCPRCIEDAAVAREAEAKAARRRAAEEARTEGWAKPGAPTKLPKPVAAAATAPAVDEVAAT